MNKEQAKIILKELTQKQRNWLDEASFKNDEVSKLMCQYHLGKIEAFERAIEVIDMINEN